ncbi:MAG: acetyl-CoA carboxylase biotin carboxyl carrier protein [Candidatus Binatia bacterium]
MSNGAVNVAELMTLIRLMDQNHLSEIEIENETSKIRLVKERGRYAATVAPEEPTHAQAAPEAAARAAAPDNCRPIISPMVGTFYRAPSPEAAPFVEVGAIVEKGETLCIIEAMKMMNEIEAEFRGRVARIIAENGQTVEYGESLFQIEPL